MNGRDILRTKYLLEAFCRQKTCLRSPIESRPPKGNLKTVDLAEVFYRHKISRWSSMGRKDTRGPRQETILMVLQKSSIDSRITYGGRKPRRVQKTDDLPKKTLHPENLLEFFYRYNNIHRQKNYQMLSLDKRRLKGTL